MTECENCLIWFIAADFLQELHLWLFLFNSKTVKFVAPKCWYCTPAWDLNAIPFTFKSETVHMVAGGRMESEFCSPLAVILLVICWVKTWDLTLQGAANDLLTQGQLLLNSKCHFMQVLQCDRVCSGARSRGVEGRARNQCPSLHAPFHLAPWRAACGHTGLGRWCDLFSSARGVTCAFPRVHLTVWTSRLHVWY